MPSYNNIVICALLGVNNLSKERDRIEQKQNNKRLDNSNNKNGQVSNIIMSDVFSSTVGTCIKIFEV